jgi:hypothetical protein
LISKFHQANNTDYDAPALSEGKRKGKGKREFADPSMNTIGLRMGSSRTSFESIDTRKGARMLEG